MIRETQQNTIKSLISIGMGCFERNKKKTHIFSKTKKAMKIYCEVAEKRIICNRK